MVHKKYLNQTKSRHTDEMNDTPVDVEPMEVRFDTFNRPIPLKYLEAKIQKRQTGNERIQRGSILTRKGNDIDSEQSKSKKRGVLLTLPVKSNGYVPFLVNTLDTIVRESNLLTVSDGGSYSVEAVWLWCRGSSAFTSHGRPFSSLRRPSPLQALNLLRGARSVAWRLMGFFLEGYRRNPRHFWSKVWLRLCARTHLKKALCFTHLFSRACNM